MSSYEVLPGARHPARTSALELERASRANAPSIPTVAAPRAARAHSGVGIAAACSALDVGSPASRTELDFVDANGTAFQGELPTELAVMLLNAVQRGELGTDAIGQFIHRLTADPQRFTPEQATVAWLLLRGDRGAPYTRVEGLDIRVSKEAVARLRGALATYFETLPPQQWQRSPLNVTQKDSDAHYAKTPAHLFMHGDMIGAILVQPFFAFDPKKNTELHTPVFGANGSYFSSPFDTVPAFMRARLDRLRTEHGAQPDVTVEVGGRRIDVDRVAAYALERTAFASDLERVHVLQWVQGVGQDFEITAGEARLLDFLLWVASDEDRLNPSAELPRPSFAGRELRLTDAAKEALLRAVESLCLRMGPQTLASDMFYPPRDPHVSGDAARAPHTYLFVNESGRLSSARFFDVADVLYYTIASEAAEWRGQVDALSLTTHPHLRALLDRAGYGDRVIPPAVI